jgi:hypothetical protein
MQESPFYFRGYYGSTEVFCKVWCDCDPRASRPNVLEEINYNCQANQRGVPLPKIIDELTAMDVDAPLFPGDSGPLTGCPYHVMVSEFHHSSEVAEGDVLEFATLLVEAT